MNIRGEGLETDLIVLLGSLKAHFPPTEKSDSGETKATETSSQFSKAFDHGKFQRSHECRYYFAQDPTSHELEGLGKYGFD